MHGTKPCFSFGKRALGVHAPPMGPFCWSKSFGNSHYFHKCMAQSHAFPLENVHLGYMAPPWGDSGGPNPSVILTIFIYVPRQNDTNCYTNAEVTLGRIVRRPPPRVVHFPYKSQYSRPWRLQNHAFPLKNVHLGCMASPWGDSGGPNPSVILITFIHA